MSDNAKASTKDIEQNIEKDAAQDQDAAKDVEQDIEKDAAKDKDIEKKFKMSENAKAWIKDIAIAVIIGFILLQFIKPTIVKEHSMQATLNEGDYIFLSRQSYNLFGSPKTGDIIVFHSSLTTADGKDKLLIKRVIGTPGDTLYITEGKVYLNGKELEEDYTLEHYTNTEMEEVTVPENHIFVMGDNRQNSIDSRDPAVGFVDLDEVVGKAVLRLFPFDSIGFLN